MLWLSESVYFTADPTSTVINPLAGQCQVMRSRFLVNRFGSLRTRHQL
ncbi:MAG: hypothetical protein F6J94_23945 [Moorea sp. SIO1F2]|nr:hypothetical protein [Moorena sp. SIO1F2]NET84855.1 hypothetical protein [Moorena sp. SIO1F2]